MSAGDETLDAETTAEPRLAALFRRLAVVSGGAVVLMLIVWIATGDATDRLDTDWTAFDRAADRAFGDSEIYRSYLEEELPYLYPPPALWLALPLRFLGFWPSFLFSAALTLGTTLLAYRLLIRLGPGGPSDSAVFAGAAFSMSTIAATLIGQYSGLWVLSLVGALWLWEHDREFLAGLCASVLLLKPNLGIPMLIVLAWSRSWTTVRGFGVGAVALAAASLPFGTSAWSGFFRNADATTQAQLDGLASEEKMITVQTALQTLTGLASDEPLIVITWLLTAAVGGIAVLALWRSPTTRAQRIRAFGALALFLVAANPRLYFYDGVLFVVGAIAWWLTRNQWHSPTLRRIADVCIAGLWIGSFGGFFFALNVIVGALCAILLVLWAADATSAPTSRPTADTTKRA